MQAFEPAQLVDLVILLTLAEAAALAAWHRWRGSGPPPREWLATLLAGLCLMLALRAALAAQDWRVWAAWLAAAGLAHGADMARRWRAVRPS